MRPVAPISIFSSLSNLANFAEFSRFISAFCNQATQVVNLVVSNANAILDVGYCIVKGSQQTITNGVTSDIIFATIDYDPSGSYNVGTGVYTVRASGMASVSAAAKLEVSAADWASGEVFRITVNHNGTDIRFSEWMAQTGTSADPQCMLSALFPVVAGDEIKIRAFQNSGVDYPLTSGTSNLYNFMQIAVDQRITT